MSKPGISETRYEPGSFIEIQNNGSAPITGTIPDKLSVFNYISTTVETPQHAQRVSGFRIWLPPSGYVRENERIQWGFGYRVYPDPVFGWTRTGYWKGLIGQPPHPVPQSLKSDLLQRAEGRSLEKLKNSNVNFAQFFGEAGQTCQLFGSTAARLAKAVIRTKKGDVAGAIKTLQPSLTSREVRRAAARVKAGARLRNQAQIVRGGVVDKAANSWLEMTFGWMPLLSDVDGAARLLAERATADSKRARFSVRSVVEEKLDDQYLYRNSSQSEIWKTKGKAICKLRIDYRFSNPALASITADGLTNPLALAWELQPFSFLSDYAIGLGAWLNRLDATLGKEFIGGSVTLFERWTREGSVAFGGQTYGRMTYTRRRMRMTRSVYGGFPEATNLALKVKNPINSVRRIGTGLALLVQACKKR